MPKRINENQLARIIADREGLKKALPISQIKEVQKLLLEELCDLIDSGRGSDVLALIERHRSSRYRYVRRVATRA